MPTSSYSRGPVRGGDMYADVLAAQRGEMPSSTAGWEHDEEKEGEERRILAKHGFVPVDELPSDGDNPEEALLRREEEGNSIFKKDRFEAPKIAGGAKNGESDNSHIEEDQFEAPKVISSDGEVENGESDNSYIDFVGDELPSDDRMRADRAVDLSRKKESIGSPSILSIMRKRDIGARRGSNKFEKQGASYVRGKADSSKDDKPAVLSRKRGRRDLPLSREALDASQEKELQLFYQRKAQTQTVPSKEYIPEYLNPMYDDMRLARNSKEVWSDTKAGMGRLHRDDLRGDTDDSGYRKPDNSKDQIPHILRREKGSRVIPMSIAELNASEDRAQQEFYGLSPKEIRASSPELSATERLTTQGLRGLSIQDVWQRHERRAAEQRYQETDERLKSLQSRTDVLHARKNEDSPSVEECIIQLTLLTEEFCTFHPNLCMPGSSKESPGMEFLFSFLFKYGHGYNAMTQHFSDVSTDGVLRVLRDGLSKAVAWSVREPNMRDNEARIAFYKYTRKCGAILDNMPYSQTQNAYVA